MNFAPRCIPRLCGFLIVAVLGLPRLAAAPLPLKRAVELALSHSTVAAAANADEQRVFASYREARNQYIPQLVLGSGLGKSWGYPLSLEGSAPSIINVNTQSALYNPSLRDFVRAAKTDWTASTLQTKDQRNQVIQDTVLSYAELSKWEALVGHLQEEHAAAIQTEQQVSERIKEGVDSPAMQNKAHLSAARLRLRLAEAQGAIDVIRNRLSHLTGLPAATIETESESMPALPEVKQDDDLAGKAVQESPGVQAADTRAAAESLRARGEHRAMLPSVDFAAQYGLLAAYNNYQDFFQPGSFQRHNATIGVVIKFPLFSATQRARAEAADALALKAKKDAETAKNQVSEETLRLQRSVEQMAAAKEVADLEYRWRNRIWSRCARGWTRAASAGMTCRMRESKLTSVTILYRMPILSWNGLRSLCCGPPANWKPGSASANDGQRT